MPQFTSPRPALRGPHKPRAPRNPMVAPAQFRQAGRHQATKPRQVQGQSLRNELRELWHPPSSD